MHNGYGASGAAIDTGVQQDFVLFQDSFDTGLDNRGVANVHPDGVSSLYSFGIFADPNDNDALKLLVNDRNNNRVLIFNTLPADGTATPDVVVGQPSFTVNAVNAGEATPNAAGLDEPVGVTVCTNGTMFVADSANHRILAFNSIPTQNGQAADFVIGQESFTDNLSGTTASKLSAPYNAHCIDDKLFVADKENNRIVVFSPIPTASNASASFVIGQADLTTGTAGCSASSLNRPYEVAWHNGVFYIADGGNRRFVVFNSIPTTNGTSADFAVGQTDLTSCEANQGLAAPTDSSLASANSMAFQGSWLAAGDHTNRRVLFFQLPIAASGKPASALIGHDTFDTDVLADPPAQGTLANTRGLIFDGSFIWVADPSNNRLQILQSPVQ